MPIKKFRFIFRPFRVLTLQGKPQVRVAEIIFFSKILNKDISNYILVSKNNKFPIAEFI